ncbi:MAG: PilZ domain-containing protein [Desulfosporosinus sp.]|nr:PilZ domain-containing protein [Desulfosporosinus sp.]
MSKDNRDEIRMDVHLDAIGTFSSKVEENLPNRFKVKIVDLSSSGLRYVTDLDIPKYITLCFDLYLDDLSINVKTEIVWKNQIENDYTYGCRLIDLNSDEQQQLKRYVDKEQLRLRIMIYQEALPYGEYIPLSHDINPELDKLFEKKYVTLRDASGNEYSKHLVETYLIKEGKFKGRLYHIFTLVIGKPVMNYDPYDYLNLSEYVDITFRFTIFEINDSVYPVPVNPDHRLLKIKDF